MGCKNALDLSKESLRCDYLNKLNFTKNLLIDLLPEDQQIRLKMKSLHSTLERIINLLKVEKEGQDFDQAYEIIAEGDDILEFIYLAAENEIYIKVKERFQLNPDYSWELFNKVYKKLHNISDQIQNLSEINNNDVSEIQKALMQVAIIFNNNLNKDLREDKYLARRLNAIYHFVRGELNESLHIKGNQVDTEWNILQKAKNEYERALEYDNNLIKARDKLAEIKKSIV
ncbi:MULTISPECIES: hypothetical protein [unclassified Candidatus Frackibacter]|uniref:hypothetical protein n=1 Tax=unclassified Candidatus Frackibacter TaxID=2648818 RepID=UPI0007916741|nr:MULTISPECIES: hypothetical protein [unclassified Candidatus Frackibacter]KXS40593.1 MAG: hypothetical protein AWU54_1923 [Candidatus Frackibacter sp. T328-2]SDC61734.1 hypothetical protein SAMN04515661_11624 [Candidatus Frackibacter sp. WG11]SEM75506.1 hypothetical protein SAMN04488698_11525 [Candidatus Frackibacter sp. WG12]SFL86745.1 hypothetical protein SAMN04488699_11745 [Candidatus Frackibacter sp. WG13]